MIGKEKKDSCCSDEQNSGNTESCCSSEINEEPAIDDNCGCGCGCDTEEQSSSTEIIPFDITIDGQQITVTDPLKNIVEIAKEAGIAIPAPCFLSKRNNGCCSACVVEINGEQKYACCSKAQDGMNIIVNRDDLKALRKERLIQYRDAVRNNVRLKCCCE